MTEKAMIEFTGEELDEILAYQHQIGAETIQDAVMDAVRSATDGQ